jgi:hypothetical protein
VNIILDDHYYKVSLFLFLCGIRKSCFMLVEEKNRFVELERKVAPIRDNKD